MIKLVIFIYLLAVLSSCSFNSKSEFWTKNNKNELKINKIIKKNDKNLTFNKLKEEIIKYGQNSNFPDINN